MSEQIDLTDYADSDSEHDLEWVEKRLGEIFDSIYSGGTPKKGKDEYYDGNVPFVKIKDLNEQQGGGVTTAEDYITEQAIEETSTRAFDSGTLLMTIYGSLAETAIVQSRVATNQGILGLWDANEDNVLYVRYAIDNTQPKLASLSRQTTQANLGKGIVKKHKIPIPPLSEQRKIATILYTVDQAIENTERVIDQINNIKEGVKNDLLTGGLRDAETTETRLGPVSTKIPTHWNTERIGELFTDRQLGTDKRGSTEDGENIDLIKMGNIGFGTWDLSEVEKVEKDPELLEEVNLNQGDLLFNTRNTPELVGKTAVWEFDHEAVYDNNLLRLRFGNRVSSGHFVNAYLSSSIGRRQLRSRVHGTTSVAAIYWTDLQQVEIPVPPKDEQKEIVDTLSELDKNVKRNKLYRDRLQRLKQGLMQDLLSGTIRTTDTNITVPDEVAQHG